MLTKLLLITLLAFSIAACATPTQQYDTAQQAYQQQDYHSAFVKLKPLAEDGDAKSQYAIGFMYYYGIGTNINQQEALSWIAKSAKQNYPPAVAALQKLQNQGMSQDSNPTFTNM